MYLPSAYTPPIQWLFVCLSAPLRKKPTDDNASVTLLSVLIDIIISQIVMQPNLKCFYWRDVVFTLTALGVFPCFRVLRLVMFKCGLDDVLTSSHSHIFCALLHHKSLVLLLERLAAAGMAGDAVGLSAPAGVCHDIEVGAATPEHTSVTVCIAFVGPSSSSKVTIVFSKIRERVKKF